MTLDEAIRHVEEKAKRLRTEAEQIRNIGELISNPKYPYNEPVKNCLECAKEHEQLAEWLKHYQQMCKIINEWNADYCYHEHSQKYYFDKLIGTFKEEKNDE